MLKNRNNDFRNYDFCTDHILIKNYMYLIVIWRVTWNRDNKSFRSKVQYAVLEKWIYENFRGPFYDDVINRNHSYLWSNEELRIKTEYHNHKSVPTAWEFKIAVLWSFFTLSTKSVFWRSLSTKLVTSDNLIETI